MRHMLPIFHTFVPLFITCFISLAQAQTDPGFKNSYQKAKRSKIQFALHKVDEYNAEAKRKGLPPIRYQAYRLTRMQIPILDFVFPALDEKQFAAVKALYGNHTLTNAKPGRHDYNLTDFMPPVIQAVNGHTFEYGTAEVPEFNEGRNGPFGSPDAPIDAYVVASINCWGTTYNILRSRSFASPPPAPVPFTLFYTGRFQAHDFFSRLGDKIAGIPVAKGSKAVIPANIPADTGDLIFVITESQLYKDYEADRDGNMISGTPSSKMITMEHAAVYIDRNLVFEKSNGGTDDPFRFMALDQAVKNYSDYKPTTLELRRYTGELPDARETFGGTSYAADERYQRPIPGYLQPSFTMSKEILYPHDGEYYNSYNFAADVNLELDQNTGRFVLAPQAYQSQTFDIRAVVDALKKKR